MKWTFLAAALVTLSLAACDKDEAPRPTTAAPAPTMAPEAQPAEERAPVAGRDDTLARPLAPEGPMFARDAAFETRAVEVMGEIASILEERKEDCARMASELRAYIGENREVLVAARDYSRNLDAAAREDFLAKNAGAMKDASIKALAGAAACGNSAEVQAALSELPR